MRMMCHYAGVDFEDRTFEVHGQPGNWDASSWFSVKPQLAARNPLINLPFVLDGDLVVTQSNACLTYLGRKFKLNGKDDAEMTRVEQVLAQVMDLRNDAVAVFYGREKDQDKYLDATVPTHLTKLENWFAHHKTKFSASNEVTTGDFHLWEMLDQNEGFAKSKGKGSIFANRPHLTQFYADFRALPALQNYFASDAYKRPVNNKMAIWL
uniref:glutathione transferase n=1 Tax=Arcella intermedia TaxID=1963864 RepID=A0A6B2LGZ4_9EUKA